MRSVYKLCLMLLLLHSGSSAVAQIEITDSHGKYRFSEPPKRVVVLNWALAEQMLELGEVPLGMADVNGFRRHASKPVVPDSIIDLGDRLSPDLEKIRQLEPEIIVIGYSQRPLIRTLSNIATVIYFKNFGHRYDNQAKARSRFLELGKLFAKSDLAENILAQRDSRLLALRQSLETEFAEKELPVVQILVPGSGRTPTNWVFGENSMPYYAAMELGLTVSGNDENDKFGTARLSAQELQELASKTAAPLCRLYLSSYSSEPAPVTGNGECAAELSYQNAFGGVMSVQYLAEAIHQVLMDQ